MNMRVRICKKEHPITCRHSHTVAIDSPSPKPGERWICLYPSVCEKCTFKGDVKIIDINQSGGQNGRRREHSLV